MSLAKTCLAWRDVSKKACGVNNEATPAKQPHVKGTLPSARSCRCRVREDRKLKYDYTEHLSVKVLSARMRNWFVLIVKVE